MIASEAFVRVALLLIGAPALGGAIAAAIHEHRTMRRYGRRSSDH
jgi:hypothetical protein